MRAKIAERLASGPGSGAAGEAAAGGGLLAQLVGGAGAR
jgi:hypothetical protein